MPRIPAKSGPALHLGRLGFLLVGLVGHGSFLLFASQVPVLERALTSGNLLVQRPVDVEIEPAAEEKDSVASEPQRQPSAGARTSSRSPSRGGAPGPLRGGAKASAGEKGSGTAEETLPGGKEPAGDEYATSDSNQPPTPPYIWEIPGVIHFDPEGDPAPTKTPKAKKVTSKDVIALLRSKLHEQDAAIGMTLPAAGNISTVVKEAVWASEVPWDGTATVAVTIAPDGSVASVIVKSSSGGSVEQWNAVASNVKAMLASRPLNLTEEYKNGALVVLNVQSKMQTPSGANPKNPIKLGPTSKFDFSDIGAKPVHVVNAQFSVTALE